jgi:hypothetical protein
MALNILQCSSRFGHQSQATETSAKLTMPTVNCSQKGHDEKPVDSIFSSLYEAK